MSAWTRLGLLLGVSACAGSPTGYRPPQASPLGRSEVGDSVVTPVPQYRLAWIYPERARPEKGLLGGIRLEQRADGVTLADTAASVMLEGGRPVPERDGGGFVFWSRWGLYRANRFLGPLQPLATTPFGADDVSFGPKVWLVRSREGDRMAIDPRAGARVTLAPQGVVDIASAGDGRVVAVLELGRALVSVDGGATYREVPDELSRQVVALWREPIGFRLELDRLATLERNGELVRRASLPQLEVGAAFRDRRLMRTPPPPAHERERWAPLNQAISSGVRGALGRALVALEASVAEVDLSSGKVLHQGPELLPGSPSCRVLRPAGELLMACQTEAATVILSKVEGEQPVLEKSFAGSPAVRVAADRVLVEMGCEPQPAPFSVCSRFAGGDWRQLSKRADPTPGASVAAANPSSVGRVPDAYAPRADGGAVALIREPARYVDLASGRTTELKGAAGTTLDDWSNCFVDGGGVLRCLTARGPRAWDAAGNAEPQVFKFSWLASAGARALGRDEMRRLFQTEDYGKTWTEVQPPPVRIDADNQKRACSEVGCTFEGWLRTGWDRTASEPSAPPILVDTPPAPTAVVPTLACQIQKAEPLHLFSSNDSISREDEAEDEPRWVAGFGVDRVAGNHYLIPLETTAFGQDGINQSMHGVLSTFLKEIQDPRSPDAQLVLGAPLRFHYVDYFDAAARLNTATVNVSELSRAARRAGTAAPDTDFEGGGPFSSIPVLSREPGRSAGFITTMVRGHVWVNAARATLLTPWNDGWNIASALLERDGSLLALVTDDRDELRVVRYRQGSGAEVYAVPTTPLRPTHDAPDALALSELGESAVLRFPSSPAPPSEEDPPLAYVPGKPVQALAPWSSLRLATDPACADKVGYRAVVSSPTSWFRLLQGGRDVLDTEAAEGMLAAVRWSKEHVCLEALEIVAAPFWHGEQRGETRVVWNLARKSAPAHIGIGSGYELREPMTCSVSVVP